jgi:hypothetical protein
MPRRIVLDELLNDGYVDTGDRITGSVQIYAKGDYRALYDKSEDRLISMYRFSKCGMRKLKPEVKK